MNTDARVFFNPAAAILLIGIYAGSMILLRLLTTHTKASTANYLLSAILLIMTLLVVTATIFLSLGSGVPLGPGRVPGSLTLTYGPLIYLYIEASIRKDFVLNWRAWLHIMPPIILFVFIALASVFTDLPSPRIGKPGALPLPALVAAASILLYVLSYVFMAARSILRHNIFVKKNSSFTDQLHSQWLLLLFAILLLPLLFVIYTFVFTKPFTGPPFPVIGAALMLIIFHVGMTCYPSIFRGFPESLQADQEDDLIPEKYQSSALEAAQKERIHLQLLRYMNTQKPFLREDLTLSQLAGELTLNNKYLSQVINERTNRHFLDFINSYRVDHAQAMLRDKTKQHYTIVAIAQESGFRSRSAFYTAFKKRTGKTPSEFRDGQMTEKGKRDQNK